MRESSIQPDVVAYTTAIKVHGFTYHQLLQASFTGSNGCTAHVTRQDKFTSIVTTFQL